MKNVKKLMPLEYIEFVLMRDVYHCTPLEFEKQPTDIVDLHIDFLNTEASARHLDSMRVQQKSKQRR